MRASDRMSWSKLYTSSLELKLHSRVSFYSSCTSVILVSLEEVMYFDTDPSQARQHTRTYFMGSGDVRSFDVRIQLAIS